MIYEWEISVVFIHICMNKNIIVTQIGSISVPGSQISRDKKELKMSYLCLVLV